MKETCSATARATKRDDRQSRAGNGEPVEPAPARLQAPRRAGAAEASRLHGLGEIEAALERSGEERRDEPGAAAQPFRLDPAPAECLDEPDRVTLERGNEPRRERDGQHGTPGETRRLYQPVVVEPERVRRERERDRRQAARVEQSTRELGRSHVERSDDRNCRPRPVDNAWKPLDERRHDEQRRRRAERPDQVRPAPWRRCPQADGEQHRGQHRDRHRVLGQQRRRAQREEKHRCGNRLHRSPE